MSDNAYHDHLDVCAQCRNNPFGLCPTGARVLEATALGLQPEQQGRTPTRQGHLVDNEFQSDKYPSCPAGKVPLSTKDKDAQDLLWTYAQRHRARDAEFSADLEKALLLKGYVPKPETACDDDDLAGVISSGHALVRQLVDAITLVRSVEEQRRLAEQRTEAAEKTARVFAKVADNEKVGRTNTEKFWKEEGTKRQDAERERDELAKLVGAAIVCASLAPDEEMAGPIAHALIVAVDKLRRERDNARARLVNARSEARDLAREACASFRQGSKEVNESCRWCGERGCSGSCKDV